MTFLSSCSIIFGAVLLTHACYSAHEHSSLLKSIASHASTASSSILIATALPLDITVESLFAVALICIGLVFGAEPLKPISWRVWAGNIEREARQGKAGASGANPFVGLETRTGFLDIRAKRREFADWVREKDTVMKS